MKRISRLACITGALLLFGIGCVRVAVPNPSENTLPMARERGDLGCVHPYYPLKIGYAVEYRGSFGGRTTDYRISVSDASPDAVRLRYSFPGTSLSGEQALDCSGGSIKAEGYLDLSSALAGGQVQTETRASHGVLLPEDLHVGSEWQTSFEVTSHNNLPEMKSVGAETVNMKIGIERKAVAEEQVTVPAGTFTALKVETDYTVRSEIPGRPIALEPTRVHATEYWVKGAGIVKSVTAGVEGTDPLEVVATKVELP